MGALNWSLLSILNAFTRFVGISDKIDSYARNSAEDADMPSEPTPHGIALILRHRRLRQEHYFFPQDLLDQVPHREHSFPRGGVTRPNVWRTSYILW